MEFVVVEEYNSAWPSEYQKEELKLVKAIGQSILGIEHIGSTSVEGLGAKPIIDIMVGVNELKQADSFIIPLKELGYEYVIHKDFPSRRFFRKGLWRAGTHHLHIYEYESEEWANSILFRDYLRSHPETVQQYNQLKTELAEKHSNGRLAYTNAKHPFITEIIRRAKL